jgi:hypothetical protein
VRHSSREPKTNPARLSVCLEHIEAIELVVPNSINCDEHPAASGSDWRTLLRSEIRSMRNHSRALLVLMPRLAFPVSFDRKNRLTWEHRLESEHCVE